MILEIQVMGQAQKCGGVKPVNGIRTCIANYSQTFTPMTY